MFHFGVGNMSDEVTSHDRHMSEFVEGEKIQHRRSANFGSVFANGAVLSAISASQMFTLTFYEDVVGLNSETVMKASGDAPVKTAFKDDDVTPHREDKVRVTLPPHAIQNLLSLLLNNVGAESQKTSQEKSSE
jgi:hypothetical protein